MRKIDLPSTVEGKGQKNKQSHKGKSFGYQILGFGSGGAGSPFIVASGGTPCTGAISGDYKSHKFTGPGTFTVCSVGTCAGSNTVEYLVVAGGASGGPAGGYNGGTAGGGGAGGFRTNVPSPATGGEAVTATGYPITVGAGGAAKTGRGSGGGPGASGNNGNDSSYAGASTITSTAGGFGIA